MLWRGDESNDLLLNSSSILNIKCLCQPGSLIPYFTLGYKQLHGKIVPSWLQQARKGSFTSHPIISSSPYLHEAQEQGPNCPSWISIGIVLSPVPCLPSWGYLLTPGVWRQAVELQQKYGKVSSLWNITQKPTNAITKGGDYTFSSPLATGSGIRLSG